MTQTKSPTIKSAPRRSVTAMFGPPMPSPGVVARARLFRMLSTGFGSRLTVVVAPPGAGKTTLLSSWAATHGVGDCAWITLRERDDLPGTFWSGVGDALDELEPEAASGFSDSVRSSPLDIVDATRRLPAVSTKLPGATSTLVLDDLHVLRNEEIRLGLAEFVQLAPAWLHLVIATRVEPALPLHLLRARADIVEICDRDLRFTQAEVAQFVEQAGLSQLDDDDVTRLMTTTEGWPAGLQLATASLRHTEQPKDFLQRFAGTDRYVADFLIHEVLDHQPPAICDFLLDISVLDQMSPALCDAVIGREDSAETLDVVHRNQLFVSLADEDGDSYRFHPLFRELLQHLLKSRHPHRDRELRERAARYYVAVGDHARSVAQWLGLGDHAAAIELMNAHAEAMRDEGRFDVLRSWLQATSELSGSDDVWTLIGHARRLGYVGEHDAQSEVLDRATCLLARQPDDGAWAAVRTLRGCSLLSQSDIDQARAMLGDVVEDLKILRRQSDSFEQSQMKATASVAMALSCTFSGDTEMARSLLARSAALSVEPSTTVMSRAVLALAAYTDGNLVFADAQLAGARLEAELYGVGPAHPAVHLGVLTEGLLLLERNDYSGAAEAFEEHIASAGDDCSPSVLIARLAQIEISSSSALIDEAFSTLNLVRRRHGHYGDATTTAWIDRMEARVLMRSGMADSAYKFLSTLPASPALHLIRADADLLTGHVAEAKKQCERFVARTTRERLGAAIITAKVALAEEDEEAAACEMSTVVKIAAEQHFVHTVLAGRDDLIKAIVNCVGLAESGYVRELRDHWERTPSTFAHSGTRSGLVEPLSDREREVFAVLVDTAVVTGDRRQVVRLDQYGQDPRSGDLPQTRLPDPR